MKKCTYCGEQYSDDATICSRDQYPLTNFHPASVTTPESRVDKSLPWQIVVPAAVWLAVNFLLGGFWGSGAVFMFGLATAFWAVIDCAKIQTRGSAVLGIAFKPVVVFAVCAYLFWGLGFIWYLVMRYRIKSTPVDLKSESQEVVR